MEIIKSSTYRQGFQVILRFKLTQYVRDEELLRSLVTYLRCGSYTQASRDVGEFICTKFSDIINQIIPYFIKYPGPHPPRVGLPPPRGEFSELNILILLIFVK